jgi:hypothetical protein
MSVHAYLDRSGCESSLNAGGKEWVFYVGVDVQKGLQRRTGCNAVWIVAWDEVGSAACVEEGGGKR